MTTDQDIAELCRDIYPGRQPIEWNQIELPDDGVAFGLKDFGTAIALIFRGTVTIQDWLRDLEADADPFEHDGLGPVHPGFFCGLPELWDRLKPVLTEKPCIIELLPRRAAGPIATATGGRTISSQTFLLRPLSRTMSIRRHSFRSARHRPMTTCSETFSFRGTRRRYMR